ncbi:anthranilate synthase component 2 [Halogranum amylolyticum]|uniref:anthranilate synthase n=1 Tax=Halogranum amylolyticum TaxID=660520 RepID=A0A1H8VA20_9EURY|nr:aminodeoxychorismate/anthranilate synthase component II [Halogranum amylolyticum]SEP12312.1 anthranilate synthase component 2 [Halogranum amylolyticum]
MILIIDNYDSFVYNLVQYVGQFDRVVVRRNDEISIPEIRTSDPDGVIVSPGPGTPQEAGISMNIFSEAELPVLGVCLGHQALCAAHGTSVGHAPTVVHGKTSEVVHEGTDLYEGVPDLFEVGRYHSLAIDGDNLPEALVETAYTNDDREIAMSVRHTERPHFGVQFHPESILTDVGKRVIQNFCTSIVHNRGL